MNAMNPLRFPLTILANRTGAVPRPAWCTYLVSYRCNARCGMCDSWRMKPGNELTVEQAREVFNKIGKLDIVRLTGGEPFLRPDLLDLATVVWNCSSPSVLHITTNGSFPEQIAAFAEAFPAPRHLRFMVSFDGMHETHDASRGKAVTFDLAEETVRRLAALRRRLGIAVSINHTVISPQSMAEHDGLVKRFAPLGIEVHAVLAYADSAMYGAKRRGTRAIDLLSLTGYALHDKLRDAQVIPFIRGRLRQLHRFTNPMLRIAKRYYYRGLLARLGDKEQGRRLTPKCVALRSHLRLLPDGSVPVCQYNTEKVGNLLTQSFEEVWHGQPARASRAWVDACVGCWAECEVMPNALYSGDLLANAW